MEKKSEYKVVSRNLTFEALDSIDEVVELVDKVKKKKGDRSRTLIQAIDSECVVLGANILKQKLKKLL